MHKMARIPAERDEVLGVEFPARVDRDRDDMVDVDLPTPATGDAARLPLEVVGPHRPPSRGSRGPEIAYPPEHGWNLHRAIRRPEEAVVTSPCTA